MRVRIELKGTTPLLMHNERLANPEDQFSRAIKEITDKKTNQTDRDKAERDKLEWYGGLYTDEKGDVIMPVRNLIKCLIEAATITKSGRKISGGLSPLDLTVPFMNGGGPRHKDKLWAMGPIHVDTRSVGLGRSRIMRTRPYFPSPWGLAADFELLDDVLNFDDLVRIAELAGRAKGLGDARILGYGRFEAKVMKVK